MRAGTLPAEVAPPASRGPEPRSETSSRLKAWYVAHAPYLISQVAAILGLLSVLDGFWRHDRRLNDLFKPPLPVPARASADAVVFVSGVLLLRIAAGLRRRKRAEWHVAVGLCVAMTIAHLVRGERRPGLAAVTLLLLVALVSVRSQFTGKTDPHNRWFAVRVVAQLLAISIGYGLIWLAIPGHVPDDTSFVTRLREVVYSIVGLGGDLHIRGDRYADTFHATMLVMGLVMLCAVVVLLLRVS